MFVVATIKPWNVRAVEKKLQSRSDYFVICDPAGLTDRQLSERGVSRIFFMHWSTVVPESVWSRFECINFHPTDLPFGRGGSPYQNMMIAGMQTTVMTAHRMNGDFDAGPVYLKRHLSLAGRMQDVFEDAADVMSEMIVDILQEDPTPIAQEGAVVTFRRRRPEQSELPRSADPTLMYNHIRMLDADTYPRAFLDTPAGRFEFSHARLDGYTVQAAAHSLTANEAPESMLKLQHGAWSIAVDPQNHAAQLVLRPEGRRMNETAT